MRNLTCSVSTSELAEYLAIQLNHFFPDKQIVNKNVIIDFVQESIEKIKICFSEISLPYYISEDGNSSYFNHLNGDHYSSFLYQFSRIAFLKNQVFLANKAFLLNKALFGIDVFYKTILPRNYVFIHPLGTVLGTGAVYSNYLVIYQGVTVGSTNEGIFPSFGEKTILYSNSSIIGDSTVGKNFILGANSSLINTNISSDKLVIGSYPNHKIINNEKGKISNYFSF